MIVAALVLVVAQVATAQAGEYAYAALQSGDIAQYSLGAGGVLVPLSPADVVTGGEELSVAITPNGRSLYAGDGATGSIDEFAIGAGGTLSSLGAAHIGTAGPISLAVSPDGASLYVADDSPFDRQVDEFTIGAGGVLTPKTPAFIGAPVLTTPDAVAVSPDGTGLFVAARGLGGELLRYPIGAGGVLVGTPSADVATDPLSATTAPSAIVVTPNGQNVYVTGPEQSAGNDSVVSEFSVGAGGSVTPLAPLTVSTGSQALAEGLALSPGGQQLYLGAKIVSSTIPAGVFVFNVGAGGLLTLDPAPPALFGLNLNALTVSPDGSSLYAADVASGVYALSIGQGGNLAPKTPFAAAIGPAYQVAVHARPGAGRGVHRDTRRPRRADAAERIRLDGLRRGPRDLRLDLRRRRHGGHSGAGDPPHLRRRRVLPGHPHRDRRRRLLDRLRVHRRDRVLQRRTVGPHDAGRRDRGPVEQRVAGTAAAPTISAASVTHARFRVARTATAVSASASLPVGTAFRVTLSAPARLSIVIERLTRGLRNGSRCVAPTAALRRRHRARCTRTLASGTLTRASEPAAPTASRSPDGSGTAP